MIDAPSHDDGVVAELWNAALSGGLHTSNCGCCGGLMMRLTPEALEETVLDFLDDWDDAEVRDAVSARREARGRDAFPTWLAGLRLSPETSRKLAAAMVTLLGSIGGSRPRAATWTCNEVAYGRTT